MDKISLFQIPHTSRTCYTPTRIIISYTRNKNKLKKKKHLQLITTGVLNKRRGGECTNQKFNVNNFKEKLTKTHTKKNMAKKYNYSTT